MGHLWAFAFVFLCGCGDGVEHATQDAAGATSGGGTTGNSLSSGGQAGSGGTTSIGGTTASSTTGGGSSNSDGLVVTPTPTTSTTLSTSSSTRFSFDVSYAGVAAGTILHLELCAADRSDTTGELTVRTEAQDFRIVRDMSAFPEVASAYEAAYGTACDLAYLASPPTDVTGSTTTILSLSPPALTPAYDVVRLRPFAYVSDSQQLQFLEQGGAPVIWSYAIQ